MGFLFLCLLVFCVFSVLMLFLFVVFWCVFVVVFCMIVCFVGYVFVFVFSCFFVRRGWKSGSCFFDSLLLWAVLVLVLVLV